VVMAQEVTVRRSSNSEEQEERKVKVSYAPVRQRGLKVIARIDADGFYYPGSLILRLCYAADIGSLAKVFILHELV